MTDTDMENSPWARLQAEVQQHPRVRQAIIKKLEKRLEAKVVSFFVSFSHRLALIDDKDAEMIESLLSAEYKGGPLIVVLNSPGGYALAAERIANVCRSYSKGDFEVIVPHMAKSAATMVCFGARKIRMSSTAELGPVDPQVVFEIEPGKPRWISAAEYIKSYEQLMDSATSGKAKRIEPFLQQLQKFDARHVQSLKSQQALSRDISVRLLRSGMMEGKKDKEISESIKTFLEQEETKSHGRMINSKEAETCGLKVEVIDLQSPLWNELWELYVRTDWIVDNMVKKVMETADSSVQTPWEEE